MSIAAQSRGSLRVAGACALVIALSTALRAQDTRAVEEPVAPSSCATLTARLSSVNGKSIAAADELRLDTQRIQRAIDRCSQGRAVELEARGSKDAFLSGPLELRAGVTLRIGKGAILFASRNPRDYDRSPGGCGVVNKSGRGCKALISVDHAANAAVMGPGVIDGRGWAGLVGAKVSWWGLAQEAKVRRENQNCPFLVFASHSDNFTLYNITLKNAPMYHVYYSGGNGFTAWAVRINTPKTARNTDGIDPSSATNVTITHCFIHDGDDQVAIKAGRDGPSSHITVAHNHFYTGHGISIGSDTNGGVSAIRVTDLSIDGADNGIRIKSNFSRGGLVRDVVYDDICIRDTKNPIMMDSNYSFYGPARNLIPTFTGIVLRDVRILGPGHITLNGYDSSHCLGITFNGVMLQSPAAVRISATHAAITLGPGPVNFRPSGEDVTITGRPRPGKLPSCQGKFPVFPAVP
ncbi:MAG: glycoside hydrolase family 28 protein [Terriglobia bacterium]